MAQNHQNEGSGVAKCSKRHESHKHRSKSFARVAIRGTGDFGTPHLASFFSLFFLMLDWNLSKKDATKTQGFTAVHCIIMRSSLPIGDFNVVADWPMAQSTVSLADVQTSLGALPPVFTCLPLILTASCLSLPDTLTHSHKVAIGAIILPHLLEEE